jgi:hypothetical protein
VQTLYGTFEEAVKSGNAQQEAEAWNLLNAAFTTFEDDASQAFLLVQVVPPQIQAEIDLLVPAARLLLSVIESLLPGPPAGVTVPKAAKYTAYLPGAKFNLGEFVDQYNKKLALKTGVPAVDALKLKRIHVHGAFLHAASLHFSK